MDETQWAVRRLKQGDIGGLEVLVAHYQVRAIRTAFLVLQDESVAQDVVQDTFLRIYERIHHFNEAQAFEPYLMRSVVNAALNYARHNAKIVHDDRDLDKIEALLSGENLPEAQVESAQYSRQILAALGELSPRQRAVIVQRYYLEMSEKEMADNLQAAPGTIKWLLNAARARLRHLLSPERSDP